MRTRHAVDLEATLVGQSELTFDLAIDPGSLVSEAQASAAFADALVPQLSRVPFLIGAPVSLTVVCPALPSAWHPGRVVYPNLERWLRPLIEALSGADRLLASPSLVGSISVTTRSEDDGSDGLSIVVAYPPDRMLAKTPLTVIAI